ncbi:MAG: hypothetical protein ACJA1Z_002747 [Patiriisocius sp.]|jgi:hypothetical protein
MENPLFQKIVAEKFKKLNDLNLTIYPNPFSGKTVFHATEYFNNSKLTVFNIYIKADGKTSKKHFWPNVYSALQ